jgi:hypothetical protein
LICGRLPLSRILPQNNAKRPVFLALVGTGLALRWHWRLSDGRGSRCQIRSTSGSVPIFLALALTLPGPCRAGPLCMKCPPRGEATYWKRIHLAPRGDGLAESSAGASTGSRCNG